MHRLIIIFLLIIQLCACSRNAASDPNLAHAAYLLENEPDSLKKAAEILSKINTPYLSKADRSLFALLSVKADDKLYIKHQSDSLIIEAILYEGDHTERGLYPEALYYGGRVYTNLGDYPTALQYYHQAENLLPPTQENLTLRGKILYHTAYTLNSLCLYDDALKSAKEGLNISKSLGDSTSTSNFLELAGGISLLMDSVDMAQNYLNSAKEICRKQGSHNIGSIDVQLAKIEKIKGNTERALKILKNIREQSDPATEAFVIASKARMYLNAEVPDSAYVFASRLLRNPKFNYRHAALSILLNPALSEFVSKDSVIVYARMLASELAIHYAERDSTLSNHQQSVYNYDLHVRKESQAQKESLEWQLACLTVLLIAGIIIIVLLIRSIHNAKQTLILQKTIIELTNKLEALESRSETGTKRETCSYRGSDDENAVETLRKKLINFVEEGLPINQLEENLKNSEAYSRFIGFISNGTPEKTDWNDISTAVRGVAPEFFENLHTLSSGNLRESELHIAILMRCHFSARGIRETFKYIDKINLSCDSLNGEDERKGFDRHRFIDNLDLLSKMFPDIKITISTTITAKNYMSTDELNKLCDKYGVLWEKTAVCPSSPKEIEFMVDLDQQIETIRGARSSKKEDQCLDEKATSLRGGKNGL